MTTEHKTRVKVNMSFYVDVITESHPECISDDVMKEIILDYCEDLDEILANREDLCDAIDNWDYEKIEEIDNEREFVVEVSRTSTRFNTVKVAANNEEEAKRKALELAGSIEFPHELNAEYETQQVTHLTP